MLQVRLASLSWLLPAVKLQTPLGGLVGTLSHVFCRQDTPLVSSHVPGPSGAEQVVELGAPDTRKPSSQMRVATLSWWLESAGPKSEQGHGRT